MFCYCQKGFDVFNALDLMENKTFLEKLKFGIGDGNLQYYLYNWRCPGMESEKVRENNRIQKLLFFRYSGALIYTGQNERKF